MRQAGEWKLAGYEDVTLPLAKHVFMDSDGERNLIIFRRDIHASDWAADRHRLSAPAPPLPPSD